MNDVTLLGRLTKDPVVRYTQTGKPVAQFTMAVNRTVKNANGEYEADFIPCVAWGKIAELIGNSVHKGHRLLINGRIQVRKYDDKDGVKRYATEVVAWGMEFIELKDKNAQAANVAATEGGFEAMGEAVPFDEEIPF